MTRLCPHFKSAGLCDVEGCAHSALTRDPSLRAFGGDGLPVDSAFAAKLAKDDPATYQKCREQAILRGRLPKDVVPRSLQ